MSTLATALILSPRDVASCLSLFGVNKYVLVSIKIQSKLNPRKQITR